NEVNAKYDVGYQISRYINHQIQHSVVDYNVDSLTLEFYTNPSTIYVKANTLQQLQQISPPYYLVIKSSEVASLPLPSSAIILTHMAGTTVDKVMSNLLSRPRLKDYLIDYSVILVQ
ncbi:MAG: hypothetical protein KBD37_08780, partial [Burkholderiales bacterium]|nr:hypothetical protein [Burkholderiales bacterium]